MHHLITDADGLPLAALLTESSTVQNVGIELVGAGGVAIIAGIALCVVGDRKVTAINESTKDSTTMSNPEDAGEDV